MATVKIKLVPECHNYSVHTHSTHQWFYGNEISASVHCLTNHDRDPQQALPNEASGGLQ